MTALATPSLCSTGKHALSTAQQPRRAQNQERLRRKSSNLCTVIAKYGNNTSLYIPEAEYRLTGGMSLCALQQP